MAALRLASTCNLHKYPPSPPSPSRTIQARKHTLSTTHKNLGQFLVKQKYANRVPCQAVASPLVETAHPDVKKAPVLPFRVGHGFDLHRLEPNLPLIIGGVNIPHDRGCEAHSDGDVLLHCVVDAILGALGLPDIGQIFPDNDPKWKGAASSVFVKEAFCALPAVPAALRYYALPLCCCNAPPFMPIRASLAAAAPLLAEAPPHPFVLTCLRSTVSTSFGHTRELTKQTAQHLLPASNSFIMRHVLVAKNVRLMHEAGYDLGNIDTTLILQRPKLSPHKEAIRSNLCELLGADPSVVNIKAKTHEKVDSLGENRSIAAHTVVLLMKK